MNSKQDENMPEVEITLVAFRKGMLGGSRNL
jgi:hypothetical protein